MFYSTKFEIMFMFYSTKFEIMFMFYSTKYAVFGIKQSNYWNQAPCYAPSPMLCAKPHAMHLTVGAPPLGWGAKLHVFRGLSSRFCIIHIPFALYLFKIVIYYQVNRGYRGCFLDSRLRFVRNASYETHEVQTASSLILHTLMGLMGQTEDDYVVP